MMFIVFTLSVIIGLLGGYLGYRALFVSERDHRIVLSAYFGLKAGSLALVICALTGLLLSHPDSQDVNSDQSIVLLIDVSSSMDVADMVLDRQEVTRKSYVREAIDTFLLDHPGYPMSIIVFAGESRTLLPVTSDPTLIATFLGSIEAFNSLPGGSNFQEALRYTSAYLEDHDMHSTVAMITDGGDDFVDIDMTDISLEHIDRFFVYSVGSLAGGTVPDGYDPFGRLVPKTYQGQTVISKRNDEATSDIASDLKGKSLILDDTDALGQIASSLRSPDVGQTGSEALWWLVSVACGLVLYVGVTYLSTDIMRRLGKN